MSIRVMHGDCLQVMRALAGEGVQVDAVICDPPYCSGGVTEAGRGSATHQGLRTGTMRDGRFRWFDGDVMTTAGLCYLLREVAVAAHDLLPPTGHVMMFADWRMVPMLAPAIESAGFRYRSMIVWDKGSMGCGLGFRPAHEIIMHFTGRAPAFHSASCGNVIRAKRVHTNERDHPAEKPAALLRELIKVVVPPGGAVLDCFAGSGSMGVAAEAEGRRAILIERDASMCADIERRAAERAGLFADVAA